MSTRKLQIYTNMVYFCTVTCFNWLHLFKVTGIYDHIYDWFDILKGKGIKVLGYVIMPNHYHIILLLPEDKFNVHKIISNNKRFMAYEIVKRLDNSGQHRLLKLMEDGVSLSEKEKGKKHCVFEPSFDCKPIISEKFLIQKLNYIHTNPVRGKWNLVEDFRYFEHSSAGFYETNDYKGYEVTHYLKL